MPGRHSSMRWVIWALGTLFYFYELVLRTSPTVMTEQLTLAFGVNAATLGSLSAFYFYAYAPMQIPAGLMMDRFGARRLLTLSIAICGIGALLFGFASALFTAEAGRLLTGIGSSFAFVGMVYICSHWFEPAHLALLIGLGNSIGMLGSFTGAGPLAMAVTEWGWRGPSLTLGFTGLALATIFYFTVKGAPFSPLQKRRVGTVRELWTNLKIVFSRLQFWNNSLIALLVFITTSAFAGLWGDPFLQRTHNLSVNAASFAISMVFIGWIAGGPVTGSLSDKLGRRRPVLLGGIALVLAALLPVIYAPLSLPLIYLFLFLVGFFSSVQILCFSVAIELNPRTAKGTATAVTNLLIAIGAAIFQPFVGYLIDLTDDYRIALSCFPIALGLAFILTLFLKEARA